MLKKHHHLLVLVLLETRDKSCKYCFAGSSKESSNCNTRCNVDVIQMASKGKREPFCGRVVINVNDMISNP
jgi:hypothetical protein